MGAKYLPDALLLLMKMEISIETPIFSQLEHKKKVVMVQFPNCYSKTTGKPFRWVPRYSELEEIKKNLDIAEEQWNAQKLQGG